MIGLIEQIEFQFAGTKAGESLLVEQLELLPQDRAGCFFYERAILSNIITDDECGASLPRQYAQRLRVRTKCEITEPCVPARDLETVQRVHLHIHREQVIATMCPMLKYRI